MVGSFVLSNWTRYVKICKSQKTEGKMSQSNLNNFLSCVSSSDPKLNCITKAEENPQNVQSTTQNSQSLDQGFHLAPPVEHDQSIGGANETDVISTNCAKPDWSRASRNQLALLKEAADPAQTKITDFFELLDQIELLVNI